MIDIPHIVEIFQIWPIIGLVVALGLVLMSSIFIEGRASKYFLLAVVWIGLGVAILSAVKLFSLTNIPTAVRDTQELFATNLISGSIIFDKIFLFMTVFLSVFLGGVLVLSVSLWRKPAWEWPVYLCLLLGSLVGMILLSSTRHMIFFAVAFELASMPSYVLVGFRKFNAKSAEGSAKYVVFGAVASAIMMYGISLLYGLTGSFDFQEIALSLSGGEVQVTKMMALVCLLVGVAFKISLVPAHFWCPDAFEAAGADVGAWLSVASKSAAIVALARFVQFLTLSGNDQFNHYVVLALTVLAIVTMTVANLSAYWQTSVKRLLAYSSIAHAGYIVCGLAVISGTAGLGAVIAYILVYLLMNLGAFGVAGLIERETGSDDLTRFRGLGTRNPWLAGVMMVFLFSLVGLPPLAGFAAKWILLSVLWQNGLTILVCAILLNTMLSLFYYMRIARAMYFESADQADLPLGGAAMILVTVCAAGLLVLFIGWGVLNQFSANLAQANLEWLFRGVFSGHPFGSWIALSAGV